MWYCFSNAVMTQRKQLSIVVAAKTLNVACPMSDGQTAFGVFFNCFYSGIYFMSQEKILAIHSHSPGFGGLCLSPGMMWWGIDGWELQWIIANVDDVVPCAGWYTDAFSCTKILTETQFVWAAAHPDWTLSLFDPDDLIGIFMDFQTYIGAGRYTHDGHLHETAGPYGFTIIVVL